MIVGVQTEMRFWDNLQENDYRSLFAFYMMVEHHLWRKSSKEVLKESTSSPSEQNKNKEKKGNCLDMRKEV